MTHPKQAKRAGEHQHSRDPSALALTDHDEIKEWVEQRGGCPARVKKSGDEKDTGVIRIDFSGHTGGDTLEAISWEEFFDKFEENQLALLVQEEDASGAESRFNRLVKRSTARKAA